MKPAKQDIRGREIRLQVFARIRGNDSEPHDTRILEAVRSADMKDVQLFLPECDEVVSTGWVPEIVYKMKDTADLLQIVISPGRLRKEKGERLSDSDKSGGRCMQESSEDIRPAEIVGNTTDSPRSSSQNDEVLYRVSFDNRAIMVNGFRLSKPHFDSENDVVFDYIFQNPGRKIELAEIEAATKRTLNKKLYDIIRTLGFKNELKDIFFPHVSKTAVTFINPVTEADFRKRKLREPHLYA